MSRGRHRRPRTVLNSRSVRRVSVALAAGGAGIAAPLAAAGTAQAAPTTVHHTTTQANSASQTSTQATQSATPDEYTVVSGDTLYKIATAHDVEGGWSAVYDANKETIGGNPNLIFPGQELTLAVSQATGDQNGSSEESSSTESGSSSQAAESSSETTTADQATYPDNLDGWIREALAIMEERGIPGTYDAIYRNIMRESGGDPNAVNNWDINAQRGTPSKGLLQVIRPTFEAYHVPGTSWSQLDPVANIVAACNYAADKYGSINNVYGAY